MFSTDLSTRSYEGYAVVALRGELDLADAALVAMELTKVAAREPVIIMDLAGLEFIDSNGVAALARGRRHARQAGGELILAAPRRNVMRILAIIRVGESFSVHATVEEAAGEAGHFKRRAMSASRRPRQGWRSPAASHPQQRVLRSERKHGCHRRWSQSA
jgi:anti-sigma B factor antagonist